jgi:hypothetical protein
MFTLSSRTPTVGTTKRHPPSIGYTVSDPQPHTTTAREPELEHAPTANIQHEVSQVQSPTSQVPSPTSQLMNIHAACECRSAGFC